MKSQEKIETIFLTSKWFNLVFNHYCYKRKDQNSLKLLLVSLIVYLMVHKTLGIQSHYIPVVPWTKFSDDDDKEKPKTSSFL